MGKNQTKFRIIAHIVKPFSYFRLLSEIILLSYSGWFFSNYLPPGHGNLWYYVSLFLLSSGPLSLFYLNKHDFAEKKSDGMLAANQEKSKLLHKLILTALFTAILGIHIKICFIERYAVIGSSMEPGLMQGDAIWAEKLSAGIPLPDLSFPFNLPAKKLLYGNYNRGEIVIFRYPGMTNKPSEYFIKRIIGLPGDRFRFTERGLEINGRMLQENYLKVSPSSFYTKDFQAPVLAIPDEINRMNSIIKYSAMNGCGKEGTVPDNSLLVLGDNRLHSRDSRSVGFVPVLFVEGKLLFGEKSKR